MDAPKDHEEKIEVPDPTWAERIIKWFKILLTVKKTMLLLFGVGAVSIAGNVGEMNPWKEGATKVGLVEEAPTEHTRLVPHEHTYKHEYNHNHPHTHPELQGQLPKDHLELH